MASDLTPLSPSESTPPQPSTTTMSVVTTALSTLTPTDIFEPSSSSSLLDLFSNGLILDHIVRYLPIRVIFALCQTCQELRSILLSTPSVFRYADVSRSRGAWVVIHQHSPQQGFGIDNGGNRWRNVRMDEALTEDDFYSGPLRGVLSKLGRFKVLANVQTLVMDKLASVTNDLLHELVTSPDYHVRLLSVRGCLNLNETKLQQLLRHICRPSRPEGTPRLQGLYVFQPPPRVSPSSSSPSPHTATAVDHAGDHRAVRNESGPPPFGFAGHLVVNEPKSSFDPGGDYCLWYEPNGQAIVTGHMRRSSWEETLAACSGVVNFDAVLCTHMHADMNAVLHPASREYLDDNKPGVPPLASVALGPSGCAGCGRAPPGTPVWGRSSPREFPLLWPPPWSGNLVDAVRPPPPPPLHLHHDPDNADTDGDSHTEQPLPPQRLIASCAWCLTNRYCENCHRWWCKDCFNPSSSSSSSSETRTTEPNTKPKAQPKTESESEPDYYTTVSNTIDYPQTN